jgi:hypothetical protein
MPGVDNIAHQPLRMLENVKVFDCLNCKVQNFRFFRAYRIFGLIRRNFPL